VLTTDGPFVEAREHLGGFYIIEAEDLDAALAWASKVSGIVNTRSKSVRSLSSPAPGGVPGVARIAELDDARVGRIFREESGRAVAALIRIFGDIDIAEDAVQDAFTVVLREWPSDGLPPNPGGAHSSTARWSVDRRGRKIVSRARADDGAKAAGPRRRRRGSPTSAQPPWRRRKLRGTS
jgi:hypothetical protein